MHDYVGVIFRQIAARLRVQRGPGNPDLVSERPRRKLADGSYGRYLDSDEAPTLVTFDEHCQIDVPALFRSGAIVEYYPPAPEPAPAAPEKPARGKPATAGDQEGAGG